MISTLLPQILTATLLFLDANAQTQEPIGAIPYNFQAPLCPTDTPNKDLFMGIANTFANSSSAIVFNRAPCALASLLNKGLNEVGYLAHVTNSYASQPPFWALFAAKRVVSKPKDAVDGVNVAAAMAGTVVRSCSSVYPLPAWIEPTEEGGFVAQRVPTCQAAGFCVSEVGLEFSFKVAREKGDLVCNAGSCVEGKADDDRYLNTRDGKGNDQHVCVP